MKLLDAAIDGDIELLSEMISEGVDMNCFAGDEVCTINTQSQLMSITNHLKSSVVIISWMY